jgi:hypothetical protein
MQLEDATKAIYQRWMTEWASTGGGVPYVFDNDVADQSEPSYMRVSISLLGSQRTTIGATRKYRRAGSINVKANSPANNGRKRAEQLATLAKTVFEGKRFGQTVGEPEGIVCDVATFQEIGSDGQFWTVLVQIDFHWYETHG